MECGGLGEPQRFECHSYPWNHDLVGSFPPPRMEAFQRTGWAYLKPLTLQIILYKEEEIKIILTNIANVYITYFMHMQSCDGC